MKVVIGVGNSIRGDDALGPHVATLLRERAGKDVKVVEHAGGPELLEFWGDAEFVVIVDAVCSGSVPGTVHRLDVKDDPLPTNLFPASTHALGVAEAVELARVLDRMPKKMVVFGIEGKQFNLGAEISPELEPAIQDVVERVLKEVADA